MDYLKYIEIAAISAVIALHIIALRANLLAASAIKKALREIDKLVEFQTAETVVIFDPKRGAPKKDIDQDIEFIDAFEKFTNKDT